MVQTIPNSPKVLLFSGAGLSCPLGLPMTDGFKDIIESGPQGLLSVLKLHLGDEKFGDIEAILSSIEELNSSENLLYKHIKQRSHNGNFLEVKKSVDGLRNESRSYTIDLKKSVHAKLTTSDVEQCKSLYFHLLMEIKTVIPSSAISFFTTNYDLTFEDSIGEVIETLQNDLKINDIEDGFSVKRTVAIFDPTREYTWNPNIIEYKKLHGSLGWVVDIHKRITKSHAVNTPDDPDSVPILYPGFKGSPKNEPFLTLHRQFLQRLIMADYAIFMGFAFRDPYINSLVDIALEINTNLNIFCYNPSEIAKLPSESHIRHLIKKQRFMYVQEKIEVIENPLKLASIIKR